MKVGDRVRVAVSYLTARGAIGTINKLLRDNGRKVDRLWLVDIGGELSNVGFYEHELELYNEEISEPLCHVGHVASKATTANPKDLIGSTKVSLTKLPPVALAHGAHAMMIGADRYGAWNWRDNKVQASIYVDAAMRHLTEWFEGQETATDSGVHHLGHAIACCAILLDAQETGNLIDDRPVRGQPDLMDRVLNRLAEVIKSRKEKS